jgi:hypothetical protein
LYGGCKKADGGGHSPGANGEGQTKAFALSSFSSSVLLAEWSLFSGVSTTTGTQTDQINNLQWYLGKQ